MRASRLGSLSLQLPLQLTLLCSACSSDKPLPPPPGPKISGRVVDIETCITKNGCQGVSGVRVAFFNDNRILSETTNPDGAYTLRNVPVGVRDTLIVTDATRRGEFVSALQPTLVGSRGEDLYNIELYAMRQTGGLYAAFQQEAGVDVSQNSLYFGQVYVVEGAGMSAVLGATAASNPAGKVRYVDCNPRIKTPPCTKSLFDATRTTTGPFGEFLVVAPGTGNLTVQVTASGRTFEEVKAPVGTGYITIGLHKGQGPGTADGGTRPGG